MMGLVAPAFLDATAETLPLTSLPQNVQLAASACCGGLPGPVPGFVARPLIEMLVTITPGCADRCKRGLAQ
jgi:hypothetical protein